MAKSRACFCPRLQLSLTNCLPWSWACSILWIFIYFKYFSLLLQRPALVPWANEGANHKVLKWHSGGGGKKAVDKRKCTQRGNALDTIVFPCLAGLFMHESSFLLLLEIWQSFQIFQLFLEEVLEAELRCALSPLNSKHSPTLPLSHTHYISLLAHGVWGTNSLLCTSHLLSPHPWLLSLSLLHTLISKPFHQVLLAH